MITGIIYKYVSPSNKIYIGQTTNEDKRKREHYNCAMNNTDNMIFHKAIRKYGWNNFTYEVIFNEEFDSLEKCQNKLNEMEQYFIAKYNSYNNGYNSTLGGDTIRGYKWSDEARENHKRRIYHPHTEEAKQKIREKLLGLSQSEETRQKRSNTLYSMNKGKAVLQYDLDGNYIAEYPSSKRAAEILNISSYSNISQCCKGTRKTANGYIWKYKHYEIK